MKRTKAKFRVKDFVRSTLLGALNSRVLNGTPARYGLINGLEAVSYEELQNEERQKPGITVREVLTVIDSFRSCPVSGTYFSVIEGGNVREGNIWDLHELLQSLGQAGGEHEADKG